MTGDVSEQAVLGMEEVSICSRRSEMLATRYMYIYIYISVLRLSMPNHIL